MSEAITLSVVCAMRNVAHCVEGFLESYRNERTDDTQLVIIDAASNDGTLEILNRNRDIISVMVSERDKGIYDAWNKAVRLCKGQYVSFIGADDLIADGALKHIVSACKQFGGEPHLIAGYVVLTRQGVPVTMWGEPYDPNRIVQLMMTAQILSAHRVDWLRAVGGFDASYKSSGDYELLLRERAHLKVEVINKVLAYMEDGGTSRTSLKPFLENFRARRANGVSTVFALALLAKVLLGVVARKAGLRR